MNYKEYNKVLNQLGIKIKKRTSGMKDKIFCKIQNDKIYLQVPKNKKDEYSTFIFITVHKIIFTEYRKDDLKFVKNIKLYCLSQGWNYEKLKRTIIPWWF